MIALHYLKMKANATQVANRRVLQLHGKISAAQRIQLMQTIRTIRDKMILLAFFGIGSTGHNLQMFTVVIFLDRN
jgi:aromatic ring-opening dioxygenase catalytic subunit (LigB family)